MLVQASSSPCYKRLSIALHVQCKDSLWKLIFVLSRGAIVVLATAPANAPAISDVMILLWLGIWVRVTKLCSHIPSHLITTDSTSGTFKNKPTRTTSREDALATPNDCSLPHTSMLWVLLLIANTWSSCTALYVYEVECDHDVHAQEDPHHHTWYSGSIAMQVPHPSQSTGNIYSLCRKLCEPEHSVALLLWHTALWYSNN